ncbi:chorismate mutase [Erysipelotrichaceae bacterium OttesenSCG-928-M19]|nr:chorismate mutase [Erysipelotrichaceae bacterium OttesenSCG-928-M19]
MKNLKEYRKEIDEIDDEIIQLLNERFQISIELGNYKKENSLEVTDQTREEEIKIRILNCNTSYLVKEEILATYQSIINSSKKLQK